MNSKYILKSAAVIMLSAAMVFTFSANALRARASSLKGLEQKQTSLQEKGKELDAQIQKLQNDKAQRQQYKNALEAKSVNLEQQIDSKNIQIHQLDADILQKQNSIAEKQKAIKANSETLKRRVYALYLTGQASDLEVMLNAKNVMDLADKVEILQAISESNSKLFDELQSELTSVKAQKTAIEQNRQNVNSTKASLEQNQQQLTALAEKVSSEITSLSQNETDAEAAKANNEQAQQDAEDSINQWLSNYYATQSHRSQGGTQNSSGSGGFSDRSSGKTVSAGNASSMILEAEKYIGYPYVWGGSNPQTSFDCSGYVSWVIDHSGWNVGRLGVDGLYSICTPVSSSDAVPGDLIFYDYTYENRPKSHVGIYLGNNRAIQCDDPGVEIVNISSNYWRSHFDSFGRLS